MSLQRSLWIGIGVFFTALTGFLAYSLLTAKPVEVTVADLPGTRGPTVLAATGLTTNQNTFTGRRGSYIHLHPGVFVRNVSAQAIDPLRYQVEALDEGGHTVVSKRYKLATPLAPGEEVYLDATSDVKDYDFQKVVFSFLKGQDPVHCAVQPYVPAGDGVGVEEARGGNPAFAVYATTWHKAGFLGSEKRDSVRFTVRNDGSTLAAHPAYVVKGFDDKGQLAYVDEEGLDPLPPKQAHTVTVTDVPTGLRAIAITITVPGTAVAVHTKS